MNYIIDGLAIVWRILVFEWLRQSIVVWRLRARDHYTSSTLIGGRGGAGPSSLHSTLEGPMEYMNVRWMQSLHGFYT